MNVFGIPIEGWSIPDVLARSEKTKGPMWIVTANPEILLEARCHPEYATVIKQADIRTVDGMGLHLLGRLFGQSWYRVTGVELGEACVKMAIDRNWRVAVIGGGPGVAEAVTKRWKASFPQLGLTHEHGGYIKKNGEDDEAGEEARHRLALFAPDVLLVGFGHPKQERWIARYLTDLPQLKMVVGVGGALDYWAGSVKRAPAWLRTLGLEWLWRVVLQPWRLFRILRAVVVFPVLALLDRLRL